MQFAFPPRTNPPTLPYARSPPRRRTQLKTAALLAFAALSVLFLLSQFFGSDAATTAVPAGTPGVVIVTVLDRAALSESYIHKIVTNREDYARRHGMPSRVSSLRDANGVFCPQATSISSQMYPITSPHWTTPRHPGPSSRLSAMPWRRILTRPISFISVPTR